MKTMTSELTREDMECLAGLSKYDFMPPPRMSMDEYCAFVGEMLHATPPHHIERQKRLEKQIEVAFKM